MAAGGQKWEDSEIGELFQMADSSLLSTILSQLFYISWKLDIVFSSRYVNDTQIVKKIMLNYYTVYWINVAISTTKPVIFLLDVLWFVLTSTMFKNNLFMTNSQTHNKIRPFNINN